MSPVAHYAECRRLPHSAERRIFREQLRAMTEHVDDDEAIRLVVKRLSRPLPSGGAVIERAAILAEGSMSAEILTWIEAHAWEPEEAAPAVASRGGSGLHGMRMQSGSGSRAQAPRRYVLPPGVVN
jgi:hypothetical protein